MSSDKHVSKLQQLELQHADAGQLTDIKRSDGLTTRLEEVDSGYFLGPRVIGSIIAIALAVLCVLKLLSDIHFLHLSTGETDAIHQHIQTFYLPACSLGAQWLASYVSRTVQFYS